MNCRTFIAAAFLSAFALAAASAAPRTQISDYTGLDCTINTDKTFMYAQPNLKSDIVARLAQLTEVHIFGGKQFGKFVAFPNTDDEFARIWFDVKANGARGWVQASYINCGG